MAIGDSGMLMPVLVITSFVLGVVNISMAFTIENKYNCKKVINFSIKEWMVVSGIFGIFLFLLALGALLLMLFEENSQESKKNEPTNDKNSDSDDDDDVSTFLVIIGRSMMITFAFCFAWNIICYVLFFEGCFNDLPNYVQKWLHARMIIVFILGLSI